MILEPGGRLAVSPPTPPAWPWVCAHVGRTKRRLAFGILLAAGVFALLVGIAHEDWARIHQFSSQI